MQSIKLLREELGLTQELWAKILGIKRGQLAAIETGRRNLPSSSEPILDWIGQNMALFTVQDQHAVPDEKSIQKELKKLRIDRDRLLLALERQIAKEKNLYQTALVCTGISEKYPQVNIGLQKRLDYLGYDAGMDLEDSRAKPILRLKARIKGIEAEIQTLEEGISAGPAE